MSKQQLIEAIREQNRSASVDFLIGFNESALNDYLTRLQHQAQPRGARTVYFRPANSPAIVRSAN